MNVDKGENLVCIKEDGPSQSDIISEIIKDERPRGKIEHGGSNQGEGKNIASFSHSISKRVGVILLTLGISTVGADYVTNGGVRIKGAELLIRNNNEGIIKLFEEAGIFYSKVYREIPMEAYFESGNDELFLMGISSSAINGEELEDRLFDIAKLGFDRSFASMLRAGYVTRSDISDELISTLKDNNMVSSLATIHKKSFKWISAREIDLAASITSRPYTDYEVRDIISSGVFSVSQLAAIDAKGLIENEMYLSIYFLLKRGVIFPDVLTPEDLERIKDVNMGMFRKILSEFFVASRVLREKYFTQEIFEITPSDFIRDYGIINGRLESKHTKILPFTYKKENIFHVNWSLLNYVRIKRYIDLDEYNDMSDELTEISERIVKRQNRFDQENGEVYSYHIENDWETHKDIIETVDLFSGIKRHLLKEVIETGARKGLGKRLSKDQLETILTLISLISIIVGIITFLNKYKKN